MALTLTERFKYGAGGKLFQYLTVTQDQATSTFSAASVNMSYIDSVYDLGIYAASNTANTSVLLYTLQTTITADHLNVDMGYPMEIGSKKHLLLIGW